MLGEEFEVMQRNFLSEHCNVFVDCEENQLCYTDIFNDYVGYKPANFYVSPWTYISPPNVL